MKKISKLDYFKSDKGIQMNNKTYQSEYFAEVLESINEAMGSSSSAFKMTEDTLMNKLRNPYKDQSDLSEQVEMLFATDGIIRSIIKYIVSLPTFNYTIVPKLSENNNYKLGDLKEFHEIANEIDKYKIKFFAPIFLEKMLVKGTVYYYEIYDNDGVDYVELPSKICKIHSRKNGLLRYKVDMSKLKAIENMENILPKELLDAYQLFVAGNNEGKEGWEKNWYIVSDKGFALSLDSNIISKGVGISEFYSLLLDSEILSKAKNNVIIKDTLDTIRVLHAKIPVDKAGNIRMSSDLAQKYQQIISTGLPKGVVSLVTPFDMDNISLSDSGNKNAFDTTNKAREEVFRSGGIPSNLFGGETNSSRIVEMAIRKDTNWVLQKTLPLLEGYYSYRLRQYRTESNTTWETKFLRQSTFFKKEDTSFYKDSVSMGGSRLEYLASTDLTPSEVVGKLQLEQEVLNIDSIMLPKQTSYTISGGNKEPNENEVGRPKTDKPTEDTERINDSM